MKRFLLSYILIIILSYSNSFAQTTINFDDAAKWTAGSSALTSYATNHTYVDGVFSATGGPALRNTTAAQDGYAGALGTYSWRLTNAAASWIITISSGGVSTFSVKIRRWDSSPSPAYTLDYSVNDGTDWTNVATINNTSLDNLSDWKTFNGTINNASTNIKIRLNSSGSTERIMVDDFIWTGYASSSPTLTVDPSSLSAFSYVQGAGPSVSQSYQLSGSNLTGYTDNITITAPTNYEVSTDNSSFGASKTVAYTTATLDATTIWVRLKSGLSAGTYNAETVSNAGGGATTVNVTCSGTVYKTEPTNHVTDFSSIAGTPNYSAITITWTDATGGTVPDGYLIKASDVGYGSITAPVDGTAESDAALVKNIAQGVQTASFTGLSAATTYYFQIYPYTNSGTNINYKIDSPPQTSLLTGDAPAFPNLLFSEYVEGSSNNKAVEIINLSGSSVDLSAGAYKILLYSNGASSPSATIILTGSVANGDVHVVANTESNANILARTDQTSGSLTFNGDDALALVVGVGNDVLDVIGQIGFDPGTAWGTDPTITLDKTLRRKGTVTIGDRNGSDAFDPSVEWDGFAIDTYEGLGDPAPLPVELTSFTARVIAGKVNLNWATATEVNNFGFEVERSLSSHSSSLNGHSLPNTWEVVGFVSGAGNSNSVKEYSYTDLSLNLDLNLNLRYRLKQIDNDGSFAYSKEVEVLNSKPSTYQLSQNFPNPFNPSTVISYQLPVTAQVTLKVFDVLGNEVASLVNQQQEAGSYNVTLDASTLASGTYIYRLIAGDFVSTKKLVVLK